MGTTAAGDYERGEKRGYDSGERTAPEFLELHDQRSSHQLVGCGGGAVSGGTTQISSSCAVSGRSPPSETQRD